MLFTKSIHQIEKPDIEQFCKEFPEGQRVEYKSTLDANVMAKIPKIVSSFANTLGGVLIIGADTRGTADNKPIFPLIGIDAKTGIEESIIQKCLYGINPAVLPEVRAVPISSNPDKVIVVVNVEESVASPHAIENSTQVYYRTGNQSNPYELAKIDMIEHLFRKRQQPEELKNKLIENSRERFITHFNYYLSEYEEDEVMQNINNLSYPAIEVILSPPFPYKPIATPRDIYTRCEKEFSTKMRSYFFPGGHRQLRRIQDGVQSVVFESRPPRIYTEINKYGLIYQLQNLYLCKSRDVGEVNSSPFEVILTQIYDACLIATEIYRISKYYGSIDIIVNLYEVFDQKVSVNLMIHYFKDKQIQSNQTVLYGELANKKEEILWTIAQDILWSLDYEGEKAKKIILKVIKQS